MKHESSAVVHEFTELQSFLYDEYGTGGAFDLPTHITINYITAE